MMKNSINKFKGFTLVELMIVVAIIGILAAIAYPAYQDSVKKTRRANAQSDLTNLANWMERFYTQNGRYDEDSGGTAVTLPFTQSPEEGTAFYTVALNGSTTTSAFTLRATPVAGLTQATDGYLELTQTGAKGWDRNNDGDTLDTDETNWSR